MARIGFAGDWHGDAAWAELALSTLQGHGITKLFHVGDFGIGPGDEAFIRAVDSAAGRAGITIFVTPGNHDDPTRLDALFAPATEAPAAYADRITVLPRGYRWSLEGTTFLSLGGAGSIDRADRTEGIDWWPSEVITDADVTAATALGPVDVLITHEAGGGTSAALDAKRTVREAQAPAEVVAWCAASAAKVGTVQALTAPKVHVHGHWHVADTYKSPHGGVVYSLNKEHRAGNLAVLDTSSLSWQWISAADPGDAFATDHAEWHRRVEADRAAPFGPLSVTGLYWLRGEPQEFDGVPGVWRANTDTGIATVDLPVGSGVSRDGKPLTGRVEFEPLRGTSSLTLEWGERRLELAARSGSIVLRPRDPQSNLLHEYAGTATFPVSPAWVKTARFVAAPREAVEVDSAAGAWAKQHYDSPGSAEFEVAGSPVSLTLFGETDGTPLRAVFADRTAEDLTYPAFRNVAVRRLDADTVEIDFNRATNPPCAYSPAATCPFPPPENRLGVRIEAGELRPRARSNSD